MSSSSEDRRRRRHRLADLDGELEEGECAPGYHSSSDTEDYYNRDAASSGESDETVSDLDATASSAAASHTHKGSASAYSFVAANHNGSARASSAAAKSYGSSSAYSVAAAKHYGSGSPPSVAAAAPVIAWPCRVCGKEFGSEKAVCGHMKVHAQEAPHGRQDHQGKRKGKKVKRTSNVAVAGSWGVTGRRGFSASAARAVSLDAESDQSMPMDIVPAEPKIIYQPTPMAFAMPKSVSPSPVPEASARTSLSGESTSQKSIHDDDTDNAVTGADRIPPTEPVVHQQAAPPPAGEQAQLVHHEKPSVPPPAGKQAQPVHHKRAAPPSAGRQNQEGYACRYPECNQWFATHQALGGHVAGHKSRRVAAAAAGMPQDGAGPCRRGTRPEEAHVCKKCGAEYRTGVQLGGHMRRHWDGPPIVPKKLRLVQPLPPPAVAAAGLALHRLPDVKVDDLTLALPIKAELQSLAPAVVAAQPAPVATAERTPEPAPGPPVTGRVILFGIDIGLGVQTPSAQEGSPTTKDSASTGEQQ